MFLQMELEKSMNGLIALDIDGTLVDERGTIVPAVEEYLHSLAEQGWNFLIVTGRTFHSAIPILSPLVFPYFLAVQNGALILEMPDQRLLLKKYLDRSVIPEFERICCSESTGFVIYSGFENQNRCFYRPDCFSDELLSYLTQRRRAFREEWEEKRTFDHFEIEQFPSIKCFGTHENAARLSKSIEKQLGLHVPVIKDPFQGDYYVVQATHAKVNKGEALMDIASRIGYAGPVIAAGDDWNDCSMLEKAAIRIVMGTAPLPMQKMASVIAPPASQSGIVEGLKQAINLHSRKNA